MGGIAAKSKKNTICWVGNSAYSLILYILSSENTMALRVRFYMGLQGKCLFFI